MPRTAMRPRRVAWLAAAALGGCFALAACGPVQMGAAAIVGNQRITTATLTTQVSSLSTSYHAAGKVPLDFPAAELPQQVLSWLIRFQIRNTLASREHVVITPADVQRALAALAKEARSAGATGLSELAIVNGLPPDLISPDLGRYQAIATKLLSRLEGGRPPSSTAAQQAVDSQFNHAECLAAKSLSIRVNPQFGRLDYSNYGVVAAPGTLSAPGPGASPSPSPPSSALYRPPC